MRGGLLGGAAVVAAAAVVAPASASEEGRAPKAPTQQDRAQDLLDRLYEEHGTGAAPRDLAALYREADALVEECLGTGNLRTAETLAGQMAGHRPDSLDAQHRYARILIARGSRVRAEEELRLALRQRPTDCTSYGMLADLLRSTGRYAEAMGVHGSHLAEHAGDAGALYERARIALWDLRDLGAARAAVAGMREAAGAAAEPAARFLRENAAILQADADRMERERGVLREAEASVDRRLLAAFAAAALLLVCAWWASARRPS